MAYSRSTATTGAMITRATRKTFATWSVKVWPGPQGGRGERGDQALLTQLLFPPTAWESPGGWPEESGTYVSQQRL